MSKNKFYTVMNSLDDDLLEEAKKPLPAKKRKFHYYAIAAACLFLVIFLQFPFNQSNVTASDLHEQGYDLYVPEDADDVTYSLSEDPEAPTAQAVFSFNGDEYLYQVTKCADATASSVQTDSDTVIAWNTNGLDLSMTKTSSEATVNWYSTAANTQHTLSTSAGDDKLLSTAREVLLVTGLDMATAPAGAENVKYYVFQYNDLVVAETTFSYENNDYSYRLASTLEIAEDYADISEMNDDFAVTVPGDVDYCSAKISYNPNNNGKIIWFDVVPGVIYSLSTENNASEEMLLRLANELFDPMQGNVG